MKRALLGVLMLSLAPVLHAQLRVSDYDAAKATDVFKTYINGVGAGIKLASAFAEQHGGQPIFCPPEKPPLNQDTYQRILQDTVIAWRKKRTTGDPFVESLLLQGLQEAFPCPAAPKP